jgi:hypothetical protein
MWISKGQEQKRDIFLKEKKKKKNNNFGALHLYCGFLKYILRRKWEIFEEKICSFDIRKLYSVSKILKINICKVPVRPIF